LIVLGELHKFKDFEIEELKNHFQTIHYVKYDGVKAKDVIKEIENIINAYSVSVILLNTKAEVPNELINYLTTLNTKNISYYNLPNFMESYLNKFYIKPILTDVSFLGKIKTYSKFQYFQKRVVDIAVSLPLLVLTIPISLYSIYRIKKESPDGPIFFQQNRVGINGESFQCIKFRSMRTDVKYFNKYTQKKDPRIFPWGDFMRKSRIDELPQLLNVLKGDMHLVGPRAEWNILVEDYIKDIPYYNLRHIVKPGITGWAQVKYKYGANIEDTKEKLMYDLYYIKNWTLLLELKTILKTVATVVLNKGQ